MEINDIAIVRLGGMIGGVLLTLILISSHLTLTTLPDPTAFDIPMAIIVRQAASNIYLIYLCIIYGEIFTSLIGNMYGLERQIRRYIPVKSMWIHGWSNGHNHVDQLSGLWNASWLFISVVRICQLSLLIGSLD